jgi:pimeloyl-ACP methyl ester carboxylesterase
LPPGLHDDVLISGIRGWGTQGLVIYLHGFASSAGSSKAAYLGRRLAERGIEFHAPDLNLPDFSTLTVTRMLEQTRRLLDAAAGPVTLLGSSLGGFVAVNAAVAWPERVKNLVLMAPALDFNGEGLTGPGGASIADWKRTGHLNIFHFAYGRIVPIHYELYEDARRYDAMNANLKMPVMVFQGRRDSAVDPKTVEAWAARRPNVELHMLDDDHQLTGSLSYIWEKIELLDSLTSKSPDSLP